MSESHTGIAQLRRLHELGRPVRMLPMARDLDDIADLRAHARPGEPGRLAAAARIIVDRLGEPLAVRGTLGVSNGSLVGPTGPGSVTLNGCPGRRPRPAVAPARRTADAFAGTDNGNTVRVSSRSVSSRPPRTVGPKLPQNAPSAVIVSSLGMSRACTTTPRSRSSARPRRTIGRIR